MGDEYWTSSVQHHALGLGEGDAWEKVELWWLKEISHVVLAERRMNSDTLSSFFSCPVATP